MTVSRYGVRIGRPPKGETSGVVRNLRIHPDLDARVVAYQRRGEGQTYTAALEELITLALSAVKDGRDE